MQLTTLSEEMNKCQKTQTTQEILIKNKEEAERTYVSSFVSFCIPTVAIRHLIKIVFFPANKWQISGTFFKDMRTSFLRSSDNPRYSTAIQKMKKLSKHSRQKDKFIIKLINI